MENKDDDRITSTVISMMFSDGRKKELAIFTLLRLFRTMNDWSYIEAEKLISL